MSLISTEYGIEIIEPFLHLHRIGLLVVDPVADVFDAVLGEDVERAHGLAQAPG